MIDNCNIIRDLMPLVIDEAASEESAQCVQTHVENCDNCRTYYEGMKRISDSRKMQVEEQQLFEKATLRLRKKRRLRILRNLVIGMLIGCVLMWGGLRVWSDMMHHYNQLVYHGFYGVSLSQLQSGQVSVNIDFRGSSLLCGVDFDWVEEDGQNILYVYLERPRIKQYAQSPHNNYSCTRLPPERMETLYEIRQGKPGEYVILWQRGMEIPAASEEMEAYFVLNDEYWTLWNEQDETPDGKPIARSQEQYDRIQELRKQMNQIIVPEWQ